MKVAIIIGSTGLVGSHLVEQLTRSEYYSKLILLNRKKSAYVHAKIEEHSINFDQPDLSHIKGEDIFCAIGTTLKKAGSKEAQYKIDCEYPTLFAKLLRGGHSEQFILVSSLGANAESGNFYLRTKGQLEKNLEYLHFHSLLIVRPSLILGDRKEFRLGEKIGTIIMKALGLVMLGSLKKYKGVEASAIAAKMIAVANQHLNGIHIFESDSI
jgi:uncharacterized protein YbjT (DUF2867 family)